MASASQRPRIIAVSTAFFPLIGGAEIATEELFRHLTDHDRVVITARLSRAYPAQEVKNGITIVRVGIGWWGDRIWLALAAFWQVWRRTRGEANVRVVSVMISYGTLGSLLASRLTGAWFGVWLQEGVSEQHLTKGWFGLIALHWRLVLSRAHVAAISQSLARRAEAYGAHAVAVIPNGVNTHAFQQHAPKQLHTPLVLVTASRLEEKNGILDIIESLPDLPDAVLHIAGDGSLRASLEARAHELGVASRITWLGSVPHDALPKLFSESDIFIRPSRSEGLGNAFLEAMASQLPTLAPMVGGITDFFQPNENGLEIIPHQPRTIVDAVRTLQNNPSLRARVMSGGVETAKQYQWPIIAKQFSVWITS